MTTQVAVKFPRRASHYVELDHDGAQQRPQPRERVHVTYRWKYKRYMQLQQAILHTLTQATDFDLEGDHVSEASRHSDDSFEGEDSGDDGREHYVDVGKSKLRKPKTAPLGPQYRGSRISRDDVEDEDEDDPFSRGFEDEESDEDGDEELNGMHSSSDDAEGEDGDEIEEPYLEGESVAARPSAAVTAAQRDEMLQATRADQKAVASSLSQSVKIEAEKGRAVKKQRATFDALLGTRIKLQKSLVATNTIIGLDAEEVSNVREDAEDAIVAAEAAAFKLWSSLNDFREELHVARTGEKRKRSAMSSKVSSEKLWMHMQEQEEASLPHRNVILQRWSAKTRDPSIRAQGALVKKSDQTPIIDSLQQHLTNSDHLLRKAHTPRSCAPLQASRKVNEDARIYDDADFYGLMLKELLESKSSDTVTASAIDFDPRREAKTKKHVDTKASKGRKLRYTVHEKLQNFMAPEDRRQWGERQADELFGSLFGRTLGLGEEADGDEDEEMREPDDGVQGLTLFRT